MDNEVRFDSVSFHWEDRGSYNLLTLHNKTQAEALDTALYFGWAPRTWYKPSTWNNSVRWYKTGA